MKRMIIFITLAVVIIGVGVFFGKINLKNHTYDFKYSNFGLSIIGAVLSEIYQEDFTKIMNNVPEYLSSMHNIFTEINETSSRNANMNIRMDSIGAAWIIDSKNNIIWHDGGTGGYNSYLGEKRQIAVVILSNLPPNYRIPATVMGAKLLKDLQLL